MKTYQLYATTAATADAIEFIEISSRCNILQMIVSMFADLDADSELAQWEFSLVPYQQLSTNDARGTIGTIRAATRGPTDVGILDVCKEAVWPMRLPVSAGQRIYANAILLNTASSNVHAIIFTDEGGSIS